MRLVVHVVKLKVDSHINNYECLLQVVFTESGNKNINMALHLYDSIGNNMSDFCFTIYL